MAFDIRKLENHGGSAAAPRMWSYDAAAGSDNRAAVKGANYFDTAATLLRVGDRIAVHATDYDFDAHVSAISSGAVTIAAVDAFA